MDLTRSMVGGVPSGVRQVPAGVQAGVLVIPTLLLSFLAAGAGVLAGDVAMTRFIQTHVPAELAWLFETVNVMGTTGGAAVLTLAIGLILMLRRQPFLAALILLTLPLRALNGLLKVILGSPRPPDALVRINENAHGFGFPSGHVMGATVLYGTLFILAPHLAARRRARLIIQVSAIGMIVLAGISRIYVGAHWPSDVIGAYLWGLLVLMTASLVIRRLRVRTG